MTQTTQLAVNGTLMRGLALNDNLVDAGATFVRDDATAPCYRLWSIGDRHPAMIRTTDGTGTSVLLEIWDIPSPGWPPYWPRNPRAWPSARCSSRTLPRSLAWSANPSSSRTNGTSPNSPDGAPTPTP